MFTGAPTVDSVAVLLTGSVLGVAHGDERTHTTDPG